MIVEIYSHGDDDGFSAPYYRVIATDAQADELEKVGKETGFLVRVVHADGYPAARRFMLGFGKRSLEDT